MEIKQLLDNLRNELYDLHINYYINQVITDEEFFEERDFINAKGKALLDILTLSTMIKARKSVLDILSLLKQ